MKNLTRDVLPERIKKAEYAVRGELVLRGEKISQELLSQNHKYPFDEIVYCNIGNPQSLEQRPITYFRQLLALMQYPDLAKLPNAFPADVVERAKKSAAGIKGGMGAYSHSQGIAFIRKNVADFIEKRDGYPSNPDDIFLYNGASPGVQSVLRLLIRNEKDGIMLPIPQYPLYSASIALLEGSAVPYYLDESDNWGLSVEELESSLKEAQSKGLNTRALVVINPGNPTGQVLTKEGMEKVIEFCAKNKLVLLADEVYQENVYTKETKPFHSFKKVLRSMGSEYDNFELFSFHSVSKGFVGECGQRGGYLEAVGINDDVKAELYKLSSVDLCPNTTGQMLIDLMVRPPQKGEESYPLYTEESQGIYNSLKRRAEKLTKFLDSLDGVSCNNAEGAMYAFPQIKLPPKAVQAAKDANMKPDTFYAISLLEEAGVCVVPGSGFGQKDGTFHFRTTFLPPEAKMDQVMDRLGKFHNNFMKKYQ